jgi:lysophospholipase L1-like esterase
MRRLFRTGAFILYNCLLVAAVFGAAEFVARSYQYRKLGPKSQQPETLRDRYAGFRNNPAFSSVYSRHNAQGFRRDRDVSLAKPANTVRIFLLGGSVTYGGDTLYSEIETRPPLTNDETIDHFLEEKLSGAFPSRNWEVVNGGVKGYLLHQDLARLLSIVLRYKPDYVISIDGMNDLSALLRGPRDYDPWLLEEQETEFDQLANPRPLASVRLFAATWLRNNSVLFRTMQDWMAERLRRQRRQRRAATMEVREPVRFEDLSFPDRQQYRTSAAQLGTYLHTVREMHQVMAVDGIEDMFVLQPEIDVSRKRRTTRERRLDEFHQKVDGGLIVYGFQSLYPELTGLLTTDAERYGYHFLNLTGAFDAFEGQAFTDYCHLTPEGNRLMADRIYAALQPLISRK